MDQPSFLKEAVVYINYYDSGGKLDEEPLYVAARHLNIKIMKIQCGGYDYSITVMCENLGDLYHFGIEHMRCINEKSEWKEFIEKIPGDEKYKESKIRLLKIKLRYMEYESLRTLAEKILSEKQDSFKE